MRSSAVYAVVCLMFFSGCGIYSRGSVSSEPLSYDVVERPIRVDGSSDDWADVQENWVRGAEHLWFGQGMEPENWKGDQDLSFSWKSAWYQNKLYFLIQVTDDSVEPCSREFSWLNDCVEIYLDYNDRKGPRIEGVKTATPLGERIGKKLNGYEMHFLPSDPPNVYLNDTLAIYRLENAQTGMFVHRWNGEIKTVRTPRGYLMEIGFSVPDSPLNAGCVLGVDIAVCDDDGEGRKSLMLWSGKQVDFWITMDHYGNLTLVGNREAADKKQSPLETRLAE